ncbi:MAG: ABC transporter permease [Lachnospiraceae bacterium]|nr:ABC transporter permease [Lachnospiraceae bacterium]
MKEVKNLVKRNVLVFARDRAAVFFSVLTMLIVLGLMILFLGDMNSDSIVAVLAQMGGKRNPDEDKANASYLVQVWTLAGILLSNSVTVTMTVMGNMIGDESNNRLASFYVTPIKRLQIALGYVISAWSIGTVMCLFTLGVAELYLLVSGQTILTGMECLQLAGMIVLNTFMYSAIAYLVALFVHSESAWSGILTVVGTLVGFVGGIYLPLSAMPENVATILKGFPFLHGAAMMRVVCTKQAIETTFTGLPEEVTEEFMESMGITVMLDGNEVTFAMQAAYILVLSFLAILAAAFISSKRAVRDR